MKSDLARGHLQLVISSLEECVDLTPPDDPVLPWRLSSLGLAWRVRFEHSRDVNDLDKAQGTLEKATALAATADPVQRAGIYGNLGAVLLRRYEVTDDRESLEAASAAFQRAAADSTPGSPHHAGHLQNLAYVLALAGKDDVIVDEVFTAAGSPAHLWYDLEFQLERGKHAEAGGRWDQAATWYAAAQRRLDALVWAQVTRRFQIRQIGEGTDIAVLLAYARARADDPNGAMVALEHGRARLLSDALALSEVDPERLRAVGRSDLAEELTRAKNDVQWLEMASLRPDSGVNFLGGQDAWRVRRRLDGVLSQIRAVPGFGDVLAEPMSRDIRQLVAGRPVVYVAAAPAGGLAVVAPSDPDRDVELVFLPDLTAENLMRHTHEFHEANRSRVVDRGRWIRALDDCCEWLWPTVMGPLLGSLTAQGIRRFSIVPCGGLGLLPLHAAWTRDDSRPSGRRYALDDALIGYAPNARTLAAAAQSAEDRGLLDDVLVVANPQSLPEDVDRMRETGLETDEIRRLAPGARVLPGSEATKANVIRSLSRCSLAHFACHGQYEPTQPLQSKLLLANDERLMVYEVMAERFDQARLVVLSACETAAIGHDAPDEAVGIPTALLRAGAAGVVASLWAVPDGSTALLMRAFYRQLVGNRLAPDAALRQAQKWLRDTTNGELARDGRDAPLPASYEVTPAVRLRNASQPYDHPYYWAAFTHTGV
jgi:CHAT domain-containing protein